MGVENGSLICAKANPCELAANRRSSNITIDPYRAPLTATLSADQIDERRGTKYDERSEDYEVL